MSNLNVEFGLKLRELRLAAGLSQTALAQRAGLSSGTLPKWERGEKLPSWGTVCSLADALGVETDAFRPNHKSERNAIPEPIKQSLIRLAQQCGVSPADLTPAPAPQPVPTPRSTPSRPASASTKSSRKRKPKKTKSGKG